MTPLFVRINDKNKNKDIGKLIQLDPETNTGIVQFFNSPSDIEEIEVPKTQIVSAQIPIGTRIYFFDDSNKSWQIATFEKEDIETQKFEVIFNKSDLKFLDSKNIYVRRKEPISNPEVFLSEFLLEDINFYQNRLNYYNCVLKYRSLCNGITAFFSSIIELERHQIEIVNRVLIDPKPRYLLADEVGLGKTIEAGIILKQFFIDYPNEIKALIIVPKELINQWHHELKFRFILENEIDNNINIISFDEYEKNKTIIQKSNFLIVDEAHRLTKKDYPLLYDAVSIHGRHTKCLLLLSGTPVLNNEHGFLQMLHLLDPDIYNEENFDDFKLKIEERQEIAETISALIPENFGMIGTFLEDLVNLCPDDKILKRLIIDLEAELGTNEEDTNFLSKLEIVNNYLSEVYRIDNRILRNRRNNVQGLTPTRSGAKKIECESMNMNTLYTKCEEFRISIHSFFQNNKVFKKQEEISRTLFSDLVECLIEQKSEIDIEKLYNEFNGLFDLINTDEFINYKPLLNQIKQEILEQDYSYRYKAIKNFLLDHSTDVNIIFCTNIDLAHSLLLYLKSALCLNMKSSNYSILSSKEIINNNELLTKSDLKFVIICDSKSEEGLNLQGKNRTIIHYDIPLNPNRIEQRLGRVDRYGGSNYDCYYLSDKSNQYIENWGNILLKEIRVFEISIASLQYIIEDEIQKLKLGFLSKGTDALNEFGENLGGDNGILDKELKKINRQEKMYSSQPIKYKNWDEITEFDQDFLKTRDPILKWITDTLELKNNITGLNILTPKSLNLTTTFDLIKFAKQKGELRYSIIKDNKTRDLFSDFIFKNDLTAIHKDQDSISEIFKSLFSNKIDLLVLSSENLRRKGKRGFLLLSDGKKVEGSEIFRFYRTDNCQISLDNFNEFLIPSIDINQVRSNNFYYSYEYTFRRTTAIEQVKKNIPIRLIRPGDDYFEGLNKITDIDDRGRTFAIIRFDDEYKLTYHKKSDLFICFDYLIESNIAKVSDKLYAEHGFDKDSSQIISRKYGDMFLSPFIKRVWLNENHSPIEDQEILKILNRKFKNKRIKSTTGDINIKNNWLTLLKSSVQNWKEFILNSREQSHEAIYNDYSNLEYFTKCFRDFEIFINHKLQQLKTREINSKKEIDLNDPNYEGFEIFEYENQFNVQSTIKEFLGNGIKKPNIKCIGAGVVLITSMKNLNLN